MCHTLPRSKIAITLDETLLAEVDALVSEEKFPNRSRAIEEAVSEKIVRLSRSRLARECALLDPAEEQRMADEGLADLLEEWPEY